MFELRYKKNDEWFPLIGEPHAEVCHGEDTTDPSFVLGMGLTIDPKNIPEDAEEVYVFFHFEPGEELEEDLPEIPLL